MNMKRSADPAAKTWVLTLVSVASFMVSLGTLVVRLAMDATGLGFCFASVAATLRVGMILRQTNRTKTTRSVPGARPIGTQHNPA
jgi:hypothetical protein